MSTTTRRRKPRRYLLLGVESRGGRQIVRCLNRTTEEEFTVYKRGRRWFFYATDTPLRDATLRKHAQQLLDAESA